MNQLVFEWVFSVSSSHFLIQEAGIFFAKYFQYFLGVGFFAILLTTSGSRKRLFFFIHAALSVILSRGILTELIRFFYYHPRPDKVLGIEPLLFEASGSFPSGHTAFFFSLAVAIYLINRKRGLWYFFFALLVGLGRVMAGVHWPLDIVGGIVVGVGSGLVTYLLLLPSFRELKKEKMVSPLQTSALQENTNQKTLG